MEATSPTMTLLEPNTGIGGIDTQNSQNPNSPGGFQLASGEDSAISAFHKARKNKRSLADNFNISKIPEFQEPTVIVHPPKPSQFLRREKLRHDAPPGLSVQTDNFL